MLRIGGRKSRNKVIVGEPAIGSLRVRLYVCFGFDGRCDIDFAFRTRLLWRMPRFVSRWRTKHDSITWVNCDLSNSYLWTHANLPIGECLFSAVDIYSIKNWNIGGLCGGTLRPNFGELYLNGTISILRVNYLYPWSQIVEPAEFKHIIKQRKRKQTW